MNKKGFGLIFALMFAVMMFVLGLALAPVLQDVTDQTRADPLLNCSTTTNAQIKAVCTSVDIQQFWVGIIFGVAGLIIARSI